MRSLTRRGFLIGLGATGALSSGLLATLDGCSTPADGPSPLPIPTVRTDVHLDLSHLEVWTAEELGALELHVGGRAYRVAAQTVETRADLARLANAPPVTHVVEDVFFSAVGAQSYMIGVAGAEIVTPILAGIHVPAKDAALRAAAPGDIDDDPIHISDLTEAAIYCVFHNPQLLSLDADVAQKVKDVIASCPSFPGLKSAIRAAGKAQTPEQAKKGLSGWMVGEYLTTASGERIPNTSIGGGPPPEGAPAFRYRWAPDKAVEGATNAVVAEALERIHTDASMEGVKYLTTPGVAAQPTPIAPPMPPMPKAGAHDEHGHEEEGFAFVFPNQGVEKGRRSYEVEKRPGNKFNLEVKNPNAVGTLIGMRCINFKNEIIERTRLIGYVPGTYYPSFGAIGGGSEGLFTDIAIPAGAAKIDIYSAAIAFHVGDGADAGDPATRGEGVEEFLGAALISGILDFFIPLSLLAAGVGGHVARDLSTEVLKHLFKELGVEVLIEIVKTAFVDIFNLTTGTFSWKALGESLVEVGKGIFTAIVKFLAKPIAATLGTTLVAAIGVAAAVENATQFAAGAVGWVLKGIEIAQTGAQLVIQAVHMAQGQALYTARLEPAHPVVVTVAPRATESAYLPPGAASYTLTITAEGRTPIHVSHAFDPGEHGSLHIESPRPVPLFGTLKVDVQLFNGAKEIVGEGSVTVPNGEVIDEEQHVKVEIKAVPVPITPKSKLTHRRRLEISSAGRDLVATAVPPKADAPAKTRALGITLSQRLGVLGYAFETAMPCAGGGAASQIHLLPVVGATTTKALECGTKAPLQVAMSLGDGPSCVIAQTETRRCGVFAFDPAVGLPPSFERSAALGVLKGDSIVRARMHDAGYLVALTNVGAEVVDLSKHKRLGRPADSDLFVRRGLRIGQMSGAVSIAPLRGLHGYALLEQGGRRVQALGFSGNYLDIWARGAVIPLRGDRGSDPGRVFLDVEVDPASNVWVLSSTPGAGGAPSFAIDVYSPRGEFIVSFDGVNANALTVDLYGGVFTENAESFAGPLYVEPSVSVWAPENPKA